MGYLYVVFATLMWSFVGVMVKSASTMFSSSVITFGRFLFGFVFLGFSWKPKEEKLTLLWSRLFLIERMNAYVISGVVILLIGMFLLGIQKPVSARTANK